MNNKDDIALTNKKDLTGVTIEFIWDSPSSDSLKYYAGPRQLLWYIVLMFLTYYLKIRKVSLSFSRNLVANIRILFFTVQDFIL
jgi:hypothetical protein